MPQILVRPENISGDRFTIAGSEAHHVIRVLRKQVHDEIEIFDGNGRRFKAELTQLFADEPRAVGRIIETFSSQARSYKIILAQGLPKGSKFDYVLEKAVELGADSIHPFLSEKSLIKNSEPESKVSRWEKLVNAAAQQCAREIIPEIHAPVPLAKLEPLLKNSLAVVLWEKERTVSLRSFLARIKKDLSSLVIVVGPESGFTQKEIDWMVSLGVQPVSLGSSILRTETAGLAALSMIRYELEM